MTLEQWLLFIPAAFALNMFPGPNNILSMSNAARFGFGPAFYAGFARLPPFAAMVALTAAGLGALLAASETAFLILKCGGAAYLLYLGLGMILARATGADPAGTAGPQGGDLRTLARREFLVAASNPKAMAIFAAFMPQFLVEGSAYWLQLAEMGAAFLVMEVVAIAIYALGGVRLRSLAATARGLVWVTRGSGAALVLSGVALALTRR
jgi:threonine/homoserine/homoserine lactone efflux protein